MRENGVGNGDTTRRSDVYLNLYQKMDKNDRLAAGNTLRQYERAYTQAFADAVKKADPPKKKMGAGQADPVRGFGRNHKGVHRQFACVVRRLPCEKTVFGQHTGYKDIFFTPYSAEAPQ